MLSKKRLVLLTVSVALSNVVSSQDCLKYKVVDIDSTKSTYLIKVKHKYYKGLIESPRKNLSSTKSDKRIVVGKTYKLNLDKSNLTSRELGTNNNIYIDDKKVWSTDSDFDLFVTKGLNGLHIAVPNGCTCKK
ncbi:hypothetical protein [Spongiimicrobium sp. 2-473A-2-J]|uniref:hypothetical protein n=1 Tax=Eudoraea algarum TaxID=3417568 RepID=UPI003D36EE89